MRQEPAAVLEVADWLEARELFVYHERTMPGQSARGVFTVAGVERGRHPDLLVQGEITAAGRTLGNFVAVEVKPGNKHRDVLDGFDAVLGYFVDYACGAKYEIDGSQVDVSAIVLVTSFGPKGYLFQEEGKFDPAGIVKGPWDAYPMTFTVARLLWRQRDNIVKRLRDVLHVPEAAKGGGYRHVPRLTGPLPEVGVMVANPRRPTEVLLMLSAHPYHWQLRPGQ